MIKPDILSKIFKRYRKTFFLILDNNKRKYVQVEMASFTCCEFTKSHILNHERTTQEMKTFQPCFSLNCTLKNIEIDN